MDLAFIISPIVGSMIGYCTNWVAIKMLFKPLEEKKVLGMKVPFTPGVIPRRREKLAESIGDTVGKRLLTEDAFRRMLEGEEMQQKVRGFIRERIESLENEERSLKEILSEVISDQQEREDLKREVEKLISKGIQSLLANEKVKEIITAELKNIDSEKIEIYLESEEYQEFKSRLRDFLFTYLHNEFTQKRLSVFLEEKLENLKRSQQTVGDVLPTGVAGNLKEWLSDQGPEIVDKLVEFLSSESTKERINKKIDEFLSNNPLMEMVGGFIDKDKIINQFLDHIIEFLQETENQAELVEQVDELLDSILETEIATLAEKLDEENVTEISELLLSKLASKEALDNLLTGFEKSLINKIDTQQDAGLQEQTSLDRVIGEVIEELTNSQFLFNFLESWVHNQVDDLGNRPLTSYFENIEPGTIRKLESGFMTCLEYIIKNHVGRVLATLDFEEMVIKKVNTFDILEVESLILNVIETELKAITWFGAVLGLILGLITPVISMVT